MSSSRSAQSLVAAESIEINTHQIDFSKQNTSEDANMTDTLESLTSPGADHHEHKESPQLEADATNQVNNALSVPNWMHSTAPEGTPCDPSMPVHRTPSSNKQDPEDEAFEEPNDELPALEETNPRTGHPR